MNNVLVQKNPILISKIKSSEEVLWINDNKRSLTKFLMIYLYHMKTLLMQKLGYKDLHHILEKSFQKLGTAL